MVDEFLARGWCVIATLREAEARRHLFSESLDHTTPLQDYQTDSSPLILLSLDVTNPQDRDAVTDFVQQHGRLDALVNNAGYGLFGALEDLSEDQLRDQMEVNFFGAALLTRSLLPLLRATQGCVIFVSSTFGYMGFPLTTAYCASKFALEGLAESLYYELQPHGVRVALIEPGASRSRFSKNGAWGIGEAEAYQLQTQNYHRLRDNLKAKAKDMASMVAKRAADLADGRDRRLRVRVGRDGAIAHIFSRLVPRAIQHLVLTRLYHNLFLNQEGQ